MKHRRAQCADMTAPKQDPATRQMQCGVLNSLRYKARRMP